jgi:hypothetical protein
MHVKQEHEHTDLPPSQNESDSGFNEACGGESVPVPVVILADSSF